MNGSHHVHGDGSQDHWRNRHGLLHSEQRLLQKRACVLGETDGEWQKATGLCFPVLGLVIIILIVIIIIVVIVLIIVRSSKRTKSVAGRKAKAGKNVKTTKVEKGTNVQVFLVC